MSRFIWSFVSIHILSHFLSVVMAVVLFSTDGTLMYVHVRTRMHPITYTRRPTHPPIHAPTPTRPQDVLHFVHGIEVPAKLISGALYVRISAHIYNRRADYERLADAVAGMCPTS